MAPAQSRLMARDNVTGLALTPLMQKLLLALLALVVVGIVTTLALVFLRRRRGADLSRTALPRQHDSRSIHSRQSAQSDFVQQEKESLMSEADLPRSDSPVPEIRITLPEEMEESGKAQPGRTVVVHVGDSTVGFEPYERKLPSYQHTEGERFESLDLERIGGLKEKERY